MDLMDAIKGRRSIRKFKDAPVKDSDIIALIDAARKRQALAIPSRGIS